MVVAPLFHDRPQKLFRNVLFLSTLLIILTVDQITKELIKHHLLLGQSLPQDGPFRITFITNSGGLFGVMPGYTTFFTVASIAGILLLVLLYRTQTGSSNSMRLSLGLLVGGAIGNLIDRLRYDYVIDFIDIGPWPIFNLADSSIVIGIILLAKIVFFTSFVGGSKSSYGGAESEYTPLNASHSLPVCNTDDNGRHN